MSRKVLGLGLLASALFILLGTLLIPYAGIQQDEALFANPIFRGNSSLASQIWHWDLPVMLMSYLGAVKTLFYWPILKLFGANPWSVRLPMVLLGGATIFIFFRLAGRIASPWAAVLGAFLLATDPTFLMTGTFDWGPVAIEHFLLVTGCWALYKFGSERDSGGSKWHLILGFFVFGLALWNKAIFSWALAGLTVAAGSVLWPEVRRRLEFRTVGWAGAAFLAGCLPLLVYNARHQMATFHQDTHLEPERIASKWVQVETALHGQSLFGYIAAEEWMAPAKPATSLHGRGAVWVREHLGAHWRSGFYYVLGALLIGGFPWWRRRRAAWFSLIFMAVSWLLMASTHDAGGSAHHVVLLWPFPILFAVVALDSLPWKKIGMAVGSGMVAMNLLVVNQYIAQFERFGAWDTFTDAVYPLTRALDGSNATIWVTDWGIFDSIELLSEGRLHLRIVSGALTTDDPTAGELDQLKEMLADPQGMLVTHVHEHEAFPNVGKHLDQYVEAAGLHKELVQAIGDSNGRPIFEVFRLQR